MGCETIGSRIVCDFKGNANVLLGANGGIFNNTGDSDKWRGTGDLFMKFVISPEVMSNLKNFATFTIDAGINISPITIYDEKPGWFTGHAGMSVYLFATGIDDSDDNIVRFGLRFAGVNFGNDVVKPGVKLTEQSETDGIVGVDTKEWFSIAYAPILSFAYLNKPTGVGFKLSCKGDIGMHDTYVSNITGPKKDDNGDTVMEGGEAVIETRSYDNDAQHYGVSAGAQFFYAPFLKSDNKLLKGLFFSADYEHSYNKWEQSGGNVYTFPDTETSNDSIVFGINWGAITQDMSLFNAE